MNPRIGSKDLDSGAFDLRPAPEQANGAAALCLHGLTGTPYEVRSVAEALVKRGIRARGPIVAGHEGGPRLLAATKYRAWLRTAESELAALREEHDRVFVVGVSMGGLLGLRLAQTRPVDALVVIGTPLVLAPPIPQLLPFLRRIISFRRKSESDIRDPVARAAHPTIAAIPFDAVAQMIALQAVIIPELSRIESPILVAHGLLDETARPRDAERIHAEVGSRGKELFLLERSGHIVTVDYDRAALARAAADFLGRR